MKTSSHRIPKEQIKKNTFKPQPSIKGSVEVNKNGLSLSFKDLPGINFATANKEEYAKRIKLAINVLSIIEHDLEWINKTGGAVADFEKFTKRYIQQILDEAKKK